MKKFLCFLLSFLLTQLLLAQEKGEVELTIYNQNFGLVKDQRFFKLQKGLNRIEFQDVASLIEPTSVHFTSLTAPGSCNILEQNYEYDLVSSYKLLSKYIDKKIKVITEDERAYEGTLLSFDGDNLVIASSDGLNMITRSNNIRYIEFEKIPEGLITKPTLVWEVESDKAGKHLTEVSYLTKGINWLCEYVAVLDKDDKRVDLNGWVSIENKSGATYRDAKLKLIAGEVKRAQEKEVLYGRVEGAFKKTAPLQFQEEAFFEYHLYTLKRKTTLKNNQIKQISLLNVSSVPVTKEFIFDPSRGRWRHYYYSDEETLKENIRVEIELKNTKENNLGIPLPKGKVKVYKRDKEGALQFIGEDAIEHTPKDEKIRLYIGDAFDIVGERRRTNFKSEHRTYWETYEIILRNHKEEEVEVKVLEKLWRYSNWEIINSSNSWEKKDASTIEYKVKIPKNSEAKIVYTVKYWW